MIIFTGLLFILLQGFSPAFAGDQNKAITEEECARLPGAEIIWHLNEVRWLCCIAKNEGEYETCIPISDKKPLSKSRLNPFPPNAPRTNKPQQQ